MSATKNLAVASSYLLSPYLSLPLIQEAGIRFSLPVHKR